ncbi:MAG: hypothetical protein ABJC19_09635 [Gemmatimonadota bacterium]
MAGWLWGPAGFRAALLFGGLATALQLLADRLARRLGGRATLDRLSVYAVGVLLRFGGVVVIGVAAFRAGEGFSLPGAALGYLGAMLPLLYLETRLDQ